ncbi:uncharacterized protein PV09_03092 [Verruconis gallopava]|uniref:Uncharacterized protein n=1 Tax=Verruconis gallopava TaxID=253628 RepID=A0A0D2AFZ9_9PEZI|nr:uncharacterized protein PV09_03092 [Verruconis gallopava]KIW05898.1 hypothetical protein PV09_03092 [Verruconis gallopava]
MESQIAPESESDDDSLSSTYSAALIDPDIEAVAPNSFMDVCGVLIPLPVPRGWLEMHCHNCNANTDEAGNYFSGISGLWSHLSQCCSKIGSLLPEDGYDYVRALCVKRELSNEEGEAVRANPTLIPRLGPRGILRGDDDFVPNTYVDPVAKRDSNLDLDHLYSCPVYVRHGGQWLKLCCYKCKAVKDAAGQVFETLMPSESIFFLSITWSLQDLAKSPESQISVATQVQGGESEGNLATKGDEANGEKKERITFATWQSAFCKTRRNSLCVGDTLSELSTSEPPSDSDAAPHRGDGVIYIEDEAVSFVVVGDTIQHLECCPIYIRWHGQWYKCSCPECRANCNTAGEYFKDFAEFYEHVERCDPNIRFAPKESRFERFARCSERVGEDEVIGVAEGTVDVAKVIASI